MDDRNRIRLQHMFDYAREAVDLAHGKTRNDLDADRMLNLALVRLLEIIGEAAGRIPTEDRESLSQIPWRGIIGMRNRLIHGYDQVDFDILWNIITRDIPPLITALEMALSDKHGGE